MAGRSAALISGRAAAAIAAVFWLCAPLQAQQLPTATIEVPSQILTLDQDRLYAESAWGLRAAASIEAASQVLAVENRAIEATLTAEERSLTDRRATLTPEEFRALADAFDTRVVAIRQEQRRKERDLGALREAERQNFFAAALPSLGALLQDRQAVAILDSRAIFVAAEAIDVTDALIARLNADIGGGEPAVLRPSPDTPSPDTPNPDTPPPEPTDP